MWEHDWAPTQKKSPAKHESQGLITRIGAFTLPLTTSLPSFKTNDVSRSTIACILLTRPLSLLSHSSYTSTFSSLACNTSSTHLLSYATTLTPSPNPRPFPASLETSASHSSSCCASGSQ